MNEMMEQRRKRAKEIKTHGTIRKAVEAGSLEQFCQFLNRKTRQALQKLRKN